MCVYVLAASATDAALGKLSIKFARRVARFRSLAFARTKESVLTCRKNESAKSAACASVQSRERVGSSSRSDNELCCQRRARRLYTSLTLMNYAVRGAIYTGSATVGDGCVGLSVSVCVRNAVCSCRTKRSGRRTANAANAREERRFGLEANTAAADTGLGERGAR